MSDWSLQQTWIDRLNALLDNKADIEDTAETSIGGFTVSQAAAHKRVVDAIAECRLMIAKLAPAAGGDVPLYANNREAGTLDTTLL